VPGLRARGAPAWVPHPLVPGTARGTGAAPGMHGMPGMARRERGSRAGGAGGQVTGHDLGTQLRRHLYRLCVCAVSGILSPSSCGHKQQVAL